MTNKNPLPLRFVYTDDNLQIQLIYEQLRKIFDNKLKFNQCSVDETRRGSTIVSVHFYIMTQYEEILKVTYNDEKKTLSVHKMTENISAHLLKNKEMADMKKAFVLAVDRYALKDLFIITPNKVYKNATELVNDLFTRQHNITTKLCTSEIEYTIIFHFNERNIKLIFNLQENDENKITLEYSKKIRKISKSDITYYTNQHTSLNKTYFSAFEHCFYELYLKSEYNIPRKTKDALKVVEMIVI